MDRNFLAGYLDRIINWIPIAEEIGQKMRESESRVFWTRETLARYAPGVQQVTFFGLQVVPRGAWGSCRICGKAIYSFQVPIYDSLGKEVETFWGLSETCDPCLLKYEEAAEERRRQFVQDRTNAKLSERQVRVAKLAGEYKERLEAKQIAEVESGISRSKSKSW